MYSLLVIVGAIPVTVALTQRTAFGVEPTIGLLMICAGLLGVLACVWAAVFGDRDP